MANSWLSSAWSTVSAYVPGLTGGANTQLEPPPKVVLVPPFFQRDVRGLSRFCRSSYDYLGSRKQLSRLLRDHLQPEVRGGLLLSPPDDQRVSVRARLRHGGGSMVLRWQPTGAADLHTFLELAAALDSPGHVLCRAAYLHPASGLGAFAVAPLLAGADGGGGSGAGGGGGGGGGGAVATSAPQVGVRYSSESLAAGAIVSAGGGGGGAELERAWLAARTPHGLTLGVELRPAAPLHQLAAAAAEGLAALSGGAAATAAAAPPSTSPASAAAATTTATATAATSPPAATAPAAHAAPGSSAAPPLPPLAHLGGWLRSRSSVLLAYSPPPPPAARRGQQQAAAGSPGSSFTAAVEVADGRRVTFSFFQHVAATRQVVNPFEENEVVGITNYLDLGLQLTTAVPSGPTAAAAAPGAAPPTKQQQQQPASSSSSSGGGGGAATAAASSVDLAASWQINKNWIVKARVGSESAAAAIGVRAWHVVSAYLTASVGVDWATRTPRYGAELCVENWGPLRYERGAADVAAGRALLQRHEASPQDLANRAGRGVLVRRNVDADTAAAAAAAARGGELEAERRRVAALM